MARFKVDYQGGESRYTAGKAVDYMIASAEDIELYAEMENPAWDEEDEAFKDETATYDDLKEEILRQAKEAGIPENDLDFMYG